MPHLNKRNATLQRLRSVALHVFKCGIGNDEVWHSVTQQPISLYSLFYY